MPRGVESLILIRRFAVLTALMFWQGGFSFYAAVVVPVGQDVLGSHLAQGFITRQVTSWLNLAGAVSLVPLAWDLAASEKATLSRRAVRWAVWAGMLVLLAILFWLHQHLESLLDLDAQELREARLFRSGHRWYLWLSTIQWALSLAYAMLTLQAWRSEDQKTGMQTGGSPNEMLSA